MEIVGLGSHILECVRVRKMIDRHGDVFLRQVYTERETRFCHARRLATEQFTAIWAAKEAVFRSLGTPWKRGMAWTDVEIVIDNGTPPVVEVNGATRERMVSLGVRGFLLTTATSRAFATATCLAIKGEQAD
jgi:holo-[acyl-carrier protein] synthase